MPDYAFDTATAVTLLGEGRYATEVHDGWDIHGNANGGYLLAVAAAAMREASGRPDPISLTAHYLSPGPAGPAEVVTEVVKSGRRFATVTGSLRQGNRELIRVLGTFGDLGAAPAGSPTRAWAEPPELPPLESTIGRDPGAEGAPAIMNRLDVRFHPDDAGFTRGEKNDRPSMRGWMTFTDGRPFDTFALLLAADVFPPTVFNVDVPPGWVPTVEMTVHVRAVPAPGPLRCKFSTRFLQNGMFEEDGEMWDSQGTLVAESRQLALLALL